MLDLLATAQKPLILAGHGIRQAGAAALFRECVERAGLPVVLTQFAKDLLPYSHPLFIGHCGVRGDRAGNYAVMNADVILAIGTSLHEQTAGYERELFAPQAKIVLVDPDEGTQAKCKAYARIKWDVKRWLGEWAHAQSR